MVRPRLRQSMSAPPGSRSPGRGRGHAAEASPPGHQECAALPRAQTRSGLASLSSGAASELQRGVRQLSAASHEIGDRVTVGRGPILRELVGVLNPGLEDLEQQIDRILGGFEPP